MFRLSLAALMAAVLLPLSLCQAAKVKVWHHSTPAHYDKAHFKGAVVSSEGALRLARHLKPLAGLDATHVWDVIEDAGGNLFVATGEEGKIFKIAPDGAVSVAFASEDSQILCLALAPDGSIYAGTGPSGLVLKISPDRGGQVLCHTSESYVWCLAVDGKGDTVYAGTGPRGRIYQVTSRGKPTLFYATKQEHILCLTTGPDGTLYAGTDKNGLVYRFDDKGKGFVLYHAPQAEIRTLLVTAEGIYAGTSSPRRRGGSGSVSELGKTSSSNLSAVLVSATKGPMSKAAQESNPAKSSGGTSSSKDKEEKSSPAPAPSPPSSGENSLYRIAADGTVREVFREKALILSLLRQHGRLFVGTGMEGQLFEVDEATREHSEVARLDHGEIHCLCRRHDGSIVLGTGDPGKLYVLQDRYSQKGTVVSEVLDAKMISKWGSLRWRAEIPPGTHVSIAVRSGNLAEPDETWSSWSAEETDPASATVAAPTARFLQYRVTLTSEHPEATPSLHSLSLRYMTLNQAPEITAVKVPDLDGANQENSKKIKLEWTATDPNEDELTYSLYLRKEGWKNWVQLEDDLEKKDYEWDTTTTPAGIYQVKVVASDRKDNAADDTLTGERVSSWFAVAHTPPTVTVQVKEMDGEQAVVEATAADPLVRLTAASFTLNGKKWVNVFPTDGLFDSKNETFRFKTRALKPGSYVLVLKVTDAAGNVGSGDVEFNVQRHGTK